MTSAQSVDQARNDFNDAFARYWQSIREKVQAGDVQVFGPIKGNPRRITRMTDDEISLVETTRRGFPSKCRRVDLKNDFIKLLNNPGWRNRPLAQVRTELNIVNFLEFKRDM
jgi:hypothetical protein